MSSITDLQKQIRTLINAPRKQHALLQDMGDWNQLCSCLDVIEDTELAIDAYSANGDFNGIGSAYLLVYGLLQVIYVQQDALKNLCEALKITYSHDPSMKIIREIRNSSIGHPTRQDARKDLPRRHNFISRRTLCKNGFMLMTTYLDKRLPLFEDVSIPSLIEKQRSSLQHKLSEVLDMLRKEEAEHRDQHREDKLQELFPGTLGYNIEKIYEALYGSGGSALVEVHIEVVGQVVDSFRVELEKRGILEAYEPVRHQIEQLEYPISRLKAYFATPESSNMNKQDACIFVFFIQEQLSVLKEMAAEIDETYQRSP